MKVKDIMSAHPVCVSSNETMWAVKRVFEKHTFHHLLVVDEGVLTGVLSDRDYLKTVSPHVKSGAISSRDLETMNKKVHQIMSHKIVSIGANEPVMKAVMLFNQNKISCLPVIEDDKVVGIVSWRDVMRFLEQRVLARQQA
ncbi:CBS domain-containing protein [Planctobacterium marinum]|uniref:CBS domain-containing protein n=1 Tax=Planctobacterium marinum TaxID=1631968 RepID=UPI001E45D6CA|nr:CBS domain-containing protein [Planctobacterium marinum]MCC2605875.1 CBS domain-containing protein [Planctobacterium marinum]